MAPKPKKTKEQIEEERRLAEEAARLAEEGKKRWHAQGRLACVLCGLVLQPVSSHCLEVGLVGLYAV